MSFPDEVSFEVRITCPPAEMPEAIEAMETVCARGNWDLDFPVPDALPYTNEDADVWV